MSNLVGLLGSVNSLPRKKQMARQISPRAICSYEFVAISEINFR
jgi:hypothetical protein